ncbi:apoptosis inhibitor FLIP De1 [Common bottlenose dolphin gammaherpesvirus 1 strain Sarasota]|uniref:Apoptosis inhibitor FLIP De1 n=1 Tax=Common bottlenose dolphin gammaherpesvirus 1 strain Sarasota TaxID=2022783 RepID=A0A1Z1NDY8_9GAMA|nr:apoptosis inhibitor FLIP De1 [Common bottlenose dolphin gammaherpesvirus 1 strain Sarasota]ARW78067.1 apoptosis inhibitor FLIP De1 [Common bottlenose dolphin gammaherpesvirus 1 strain Sarasota]
MSAAVIHQLEEALDEDEKERLLFLCRDIAADSAPGTIKDLLGVLRERGHLSPAHLAELMYRIRRFDLLKRALHINAATARAILGQQPPFISAYRVLLTDIDDGLEKSDVASLAFLLRNYTGGKQVDNDKGFLSLVIELEKLNLIAPDHLDLLESCLEKIHRPDLRTKIQKYNRVAPR